MRFIDLLIGDDAAEKRFPIRLHGEDRAILPGGVGG